MSGVVLVALPGRCCTRFAPETQRVLVLARSARAWKEQQRPRAVCVVWVLWCLPFKQACSLTHLPGSAQGRPAAPPHASTTQQPTGIRPPAGGRPEGGRRAWRCRSGSVDCCAGG